jgi:signal transduction histidine kinase/predicted DsbA family dithiol-disulfide isomerase
VQPRDVFVAELRTYVLPEAPLVALHRTAGWRRPMILAVALTLFSSVLIWATVAVSEFEIFITSTTAGSAVIAAALAWWRRIHVAALMVTFTAALVPLWGFASEVQTTSPVVELLWLALAFFIGGIIIPGVLGFLALGGMWFVSVGLLLGNDAIPAPQAAEASVMLGFVCGATMLISTLGNRLERYVNANHRELERIQKKILTHNQDLDTALVREQKASRQKEEFLASFSHELRTPLNAVLGLCEALQEEVYGPLTDMQRKSLMTIEGSGRHLLGLIVDILDVARIGAGRLMTSIQPCSVGELVGVLERDIEEKARGKNLALTFDVSLDELTFQTDARQCQRILRALFLNAVKFTPEGGAVGLEVRSSDCDGFVFFTVWDEGIGMSSAELDELSQPLVQSDGGLARQYNGLGLGLTLSTRLAHLIGSSLLVESTPNEGSRFTLALPKTGPRQVTLYGDLNCPFSYALNEWFEGAGVSHLIQWQGVEHMPDLDPNLAREKNQQARLDEEISRLSDRAEQTQILLRRPVFRPNTRLALLALMRAQDFYPERLDQLRGQLFRATWRDGKDISTEETIREICAEYELGELVPSESELVRLKEASESWRATGHDCLPLAVSQRTGKSYKGLGKRTNLTDFLRDELNVSGDANESSERRDLTRYLREQHIVR